MKLTDIAPKKQEIAEAVLLEKLGNLAQLNVGPMINILRQSAGKSTKGSDWTGPITQKFVGQTIGSTSEVVDVGIIKDGMKSIRKAYRANGNASAFALYIGGHAVLFAVFDDYAMAGSSRYGKMAYDLSNFEPVLDQMDDDAWNAKPEYQKYGAKTQTPSTTYREREPSYWDQQRGKTVPDKFQGDATSTGKLSQTIDLIMTIAKSAGEPVTCKIVIADTAGQKKRSDRYFTKQEITAGYKDLMTRLKFYKNSKRPTVNTIEEFVAVSIKNQGKSVRFAGATYVLKHSGYGADKIDPGALLSGKPFDVSYSSSDPGNYDSLKLTYMFDKESNMLLPIHATWYDRTDPANKYSRQEAVLNAKGYLKMKLTVSNLDDKQAIVKRLLEVFKAAQYDEALRLIDSLEKMGKDWPELATIKKSSQVEAEKKKAA